MKWFTFISNWKEKELTCAFCGGKQSVKYLIDDKTYCNIHVIPVAMEMEGFK